MAAITLTTSGQAITGDFDLHVTGTPIQGQFTRLFKARLNVDSDYNVLEEIHGRDDYFIKNSGTFYYKVDGGSPGLVLNAVQP